MDSDEGGVCQPFGWNPPFTYFCDELFIVMKRITQNVNINWLFDELTSVFKEF